MKKNTKIILAIFALLISNILFAQSISVESFRCSKKEDLAKKSNIRNFSNQVCALIIVETHEESLEFICRDIEKQEQKQGEIWLFVSPGIERITINDRNFGPMINYTFPKKIESGKTYRMKLKTDLPHRFNDLALQEKEEKTPIKEIKTQENKKQPLFKNVKTIKIRDANAQITLFCFNRERTKVAYTTNGILDSVFVFDIEKQESVYLDDNFGTYSMLFSSDDTKLFAAGIDGVSLFDIVNKKFCKVVNELMLSSMLYSKDGTKIIMSSPSIFGFFKIFDANTFKEIKGIGNNELRLSTASFNPDASRVVCTSKDTLILIWDWANEKCIQTLEGHSDSIASVNYSLDGKKIVSGSRDKTIKIWDANTGVCLKTLTGHIDIPYFAEFSPDGTKILSVSHDGAIKIWEANTGRVIQTIQEKAEIEEGRYVGSMLVRFTPDGKRIVGVTIDNFLKIWELE